MEPKSEEAILSKIRKLLALANDSNSPEARSAAEMAKRLIEKHGIDEKKVTSDVAEFIKQVLLMKYLVPKHELDLAIMVSDFHDCVVVTSTSKSLFAPHTQRVVLVTGRVDAVERAIDQFKWIKATLDLGFKHAVVKVKGIASYKPYYIRSFWEGALDALDGRLIKQDEGQEEEEEEVNGTGASRRNEEQNIQNENEDSVGSETALAICQTTPQESVRDWLRRVYEVRESQSLVDSEERLVDGQLYLCGRTFAQGLDVSPQEEKSLNDSKTEPRKVSL